MWRQRRAVRCLRAMGAVVLAAGLVVAVATPGMSPAAAAGVKAASAAITPISQPFADPGEAGLGDWIVGPIGVAPTIGMTGATGWLALTEGQPALPTSAVGSSQSGYAIYNQPVERAGLTIDFTYADTGGGGLSLFLLDASVAQPTAAASGDGLGYALAAGPAGSGTALGIVGVGLDEAGAFSLPDAANPASGLGQVPESIVVRGSGDGVLGFSYLAGQSLATTPGVPVGATVDNVTEASGGRPVRISFGPAGMLVSMDFGSGWLPVLGPVAMPALPPSGLVKVGFAAESSGGLIAGAGQHAIRNVVISNAAAEPPVTTTTTTTKPVTTTTKPATVTTTTAARVTAAHTSPAASSLEAPAATASVAPATARWSQPSNAAIESPALRSVGGSASIGRVVAAAQGAGQISVSVNAPSSGPGTSTAVAVTITNTSGAKLAAALMVIVRPPDGVTLTPGATLPAGCTAVSTVLLSCTIPAAALPAAGSVVLNIPFTIAASAPGGTALPNGAVIVSVGSSAATDGPFALSMTTSGTPVATTVVVATTTTVAGTTATTVPGTLAFTGAPVGTTANRALLLIGAGILLVLISVARRPQRHWAHSQR